MRLGVYPLHESYDIPAFKTTGAACFDLSLNLSHITDDSIRTNADDPAEDDVPIGAIWNEELGQPDFIETDKGVVFFLPTGLVFDIPEGFYLQVSLRSGFASKYGAWMPNGVGIIDSDYTDEVLVPVLFTKTGEVIESGDRIAQAILLQKQEYDIVGINSRPGQKGNRIGGFGSSGVK